MQVPDLPLGETVARASELTRTTALGSDECDRCGQRATGQGTVERGVRAYVRHIQAGRHPAEAMYDRMAALTAGSLPACRNATRRPTQ
jgi:hypothetical protein